MPCTKTVRSRAARWLASQSTTIGKSASLELIGQPERELGQPLRRRPQGDGRRPEARADDEHVGRIVHLVGSIEHQHVDAETADLAKTLAAEERPPDRQSGERSVRVAAVDQERQYPYRRRDADERHHAVAHEQNGDVGGGDDQAGADAREVVEVVALEADDHAAVDRRTRNAGRRWRR